MIFLGKSYRGYKYTRIFLPGVKRYDFPTTPVLKVYGVYSSLYILNIKIEVHFEYIL